jgi:hypothetical protein
LALGTAAPLIRLPGQRRAPSLQPPVDLVSLGVLPLPHLVLEPRQQQDRDRIQRRGVAGDCGQGWGAEAGTEDVVAPE